MKVVAFQAKGKEVKSGIRNEKLEVRNGNCKLPITSYQLRILILLVLFTGANIHVAAIVLPFRQGLS